MKYVAFGVNCFMFILMFMVTIINNMPNNPINKDFDNNFINTIYPQGWGFYSIDPTEEDSVYLLDKNGDMAMYLPHNSKENLFGLSRYGRSQGIESGIIIEQMSNVEYSECNSYIKDCLQNDDDVVHIINPTDRPHFCGEHVVYSEEILPWAWSSSYSNDYVPSKYKRVNIEC